MDDFSGKIAVVTGGAAGMGRELVVQLASEGCHVATCDLSEEGLAETRALALDAGSGVRITTHLCDVSDEEAVLRFRDETIAQHETDHVHLVFNNAGLSGGGSVITDSRESWERCFNVCWGGVYYGTRAFLPLLIAADEGHLVNTSSVNGFWASLGPGTAHTAYSAAKFAVKGFSEALIGDLRMNAPHVQVSVVMPGHVGTSIIENSARYGGADLSEDQLSTFAAMGSYFRDKAPMSAAEAATVILDGVREGRWRILVGEDAKHLDEVVRKHPEQAYEARGTAFLADLDLDLAD